MKPLSASLLVVGLALAGNAAAQSSAYPSGYYGGAQDGYADSGYAGDQGEVYDYARVLRVDPVIESGYGNRTVRNQTQCYYRDADEVYVDNGGDYPQDRTYRGNGGYDRTGYPSRDDGYRAGSESGRTVATVLGGIAGAVLGSKIGDGSGRYVGTAVGSMVGGMAGRSIYDTSQRNRQQQRRGTVRVCEPQPVSSRDGYYEEERLAGYDVTYEYANRTYRTRTDYHPGDRIRVRVDVRPE